MSYTFYKIFHLVSIVLLFSSLSTLSFNKEKSRFFFILSGISLIFILVSGFGLLARLGVPHGNWPLWAKLKLVIWVYISTGTILIYKKFPKFDKLFFWSAFLSFGCAAYLAVYKIT